MEVLSNQNIINSKDINVSIIIPAYKNEEYLVQCLDSIVNQTLKNIEIIIVDEGDLDETRSIIDKYEEKDSRIRTIHEKNGGYGASVNKGIKIATGEYIGIVEADDYVELNMFEDLYTLAINNDAEIVKSDFNIYIPSINQTRKAGRIAQSWTKGIINIDKYPDILRIQPSIWSAIYKKEFLFKNNLFFLETRGGSYQDTSFTFKTLASANRIIMTTKSYYNYRSDNENSSVRNTGKVYAICDEYNAITQFLEENQYLKNKVNSEKLINQYNAYLWNLVRIDESFRDEFIDKISQEFKIFYENDEIDSKVIKKLKKKGIMLLITDKQAFKNYLEKYIKSKQNKFKRNRNFSIRINPSRIDIVLFGKQILKYEF